MSLWGSAFCKVGFDASARRSEQPQTQQKEQHQLEELWHCRCRWHEAFACVGEVPARPRPAKSCYKGRPARNLRRPGNPAREQRTEASRREFDTSSRWFRHLSQQHATSLLHGTLVIHRHAIAAAASYPRLATICAKFAHLCKRHEVPDC